MRRLLQVRLLFVLIALLLVPALALPYAERLRAEWARYWQPPVQVPDETTLEGYYIPDFSDPTGSMSDGRFVIVPVLGAERTKLLDREREWIEAERRLIRNEQLARELADAVGMSRVGQPPSD